MDKESGVKVKLLWLKFKVCVAKNSCLKFAVSGIKLLVCIGLFLFIVLRFCVYFAVESTLTGAIIGGVLSLSSVLVVNNAEKTGRSYRRLKHQIYQPLYDEMYRIQKYIYANNPFPQEITTYAQPQVCKQIPQYTVWGRIKSCHVYFEVPDVLKVQMDKLYDYISEYSVLIKDMPQRLDVIYNSVLKEEVGTICVWRGVGQSLFDKVLKQEAILVEDDGSNPNAFEKDIALDKATCRRIDTIFYSKCESELKLNEIRATKQRLIKTGDYIIEILGALIEFVNHKYGG